MLGIHFVEGFQCNGRQFALFALLAFNLDRLLVCLFLHGLRLQERDPSNGLTIYLDRSAEKLIRPISHLRLLAVYHRVGETIHMTRSSPDIRIHDDGAVQTNDIVTPANHILPPRILNVLPKLNP